MIKSKKGFMFIETIVSLTILMTALLLLYSVFVNLLNKEKTTTYNKKSYIYALFYMKEQLLELGFDFYLPGSGDASYGLELTTDAISETYRNNVLAGTKENEKLKGILTNSNILNTIKKFKEIYGLERLIVLPIDRIVLPTFSEDSADFETYLKTLTLNEYHSLKYTVVKIVGEFKDPNTGKYNYAYILYPNVEI